MANELTSKLALPETLEETAIKYGAIKRRRIIKSAGGLLAALLMYAMHGMSQRLLAASASAAGMADMSDQAWQKKIVLCGPWLASILKETMVKLPPAKKQFQEQAVKLIDSSIFIQAGSRGKKGGKPLKLHMCYDLSAGAMDSVLLTDGGAAEQAARFGIESGDIVLADAGFGKGKNLAHVVSLGADALFRATPNHLRLAWDARGKDRLAMAGILGDAKGGVLDFDCFVHTENREYHPVRVIASRLPEDKALAAKKRKRRNAVRKQAQLKEETLVFAEWAILITSIGRSRSAAQLLELYRARWQVELLFKRVKQSFKVRKLPPASLEHSSVMVLLWLLLWALVERRSLAAELFMAKKSMDMGRYSPWAMQSFLLFRLKAFAGCFWAGCPEAAVDLSPAFSRLLNHHSSRRNQYAFFHLGG